MLKDKWNDVNLTLWAVLLLLAGFSFLPVYSAASNLAYVSGGGNTIGFLFKHFIHLSVGFTFGVHAASYSFAVFCVLSYK